MIALVERYGGDLVFRDVDWSMPGIPFLDAVVSTGRSSNIVLVVIGERWLDELRAGQHDPMPSPVQPNAILSTWRS